MIFTNRKALMAVIVVLGLVMQTDAHGHEDIHFGVIAGKLRVEEETRAGVFASSFATTGIFQQFSSNPGFVSEDQGAEGLEPGEVVIYDVLEGLRFWSEGAFADAAPEMSLRIENNHPEVPDTIVTATSGLQPGSGAAPLRNILGVTNHAGELHAHLDYFLEPNPHPEPLPAATHGAYGVKLRLASDRPGVAPSDPFWIMFNFGLDEQSVAQALDAYAELLVPALAGDYNGDGSVDAADYVVWRNSLGSTIDLAANGDDTGSSHGRIDGADYLVWKANYGRTGTGAHSQVPAQSVPEPSGGWLAFACGLGLIAMPLAARSRTRRNKRPRNGSLGPPRRTT